MKDLFTIIVNTLREFEKREEVVGRAGSDATRRFLLADRIQAAIEGMVQEYQQLVQEIRSDAEVELDRATDIIVLMLSLAADDGEFIFDETDLRAAARKYELQIEAVDTPEGITETKSPQTRIKLVTPDEEASPLDDDSPISKNVVTIS